MSKKKLKASAQPARPKSRQLAIYYIMAALKRTANDAKDYAHMDSSIEVWIKARRRDGAIALAKRTLADEGWQLKKIHVASKVLAGFARIGAMMDPPLYTEEEADEWTEQYHIADAKGFACAFAHYCERLGVELKGRSPTSFVDRSALSNHRNALSKVAFQEPLEACFTISASSEGVFA